MYLVKCYNTLPRADMGSIPFCQFHIKSITSNSNSVFFTGSFFTYYILHWVGTLSIPSRIKELNGKLICGFHFIMGNFDSNSKFSNSIIFFSNSGIGMMVNSNSGIVLTPCLAQSHSLIDSVLHKVKQKHH